MLHGSVQPVEALLVEPFSGPPGACLGLGSSLAATLQELANTLLGVPVDGPKLSRRIAGAKVVAPASQHGIQLRDELPHVTDTAALPFRTLMDFDPHPLHASHRGPALQEVLLLPFLQDAS